MPPASTEVKEAIDDFERFQRRGAWERALKALYTIPEDQALRFVDGENGFIIPVARKRRSILAALPPDGQAAYRLFYDAEAKKLLDEADGPAELKNLERIYSAYFITSVGDNAADRLGDLYFELGRFDRAADCWLADPARTPRYRSLARLAVGEGRPGAFSRGAPGRIRADPRRAGGSLQRREGDPRRPDGLAAESSSPPARRRDEDGRARGQPSSSPAEPGPRSRRDGRPRLAVAVRRHRSKPA